MLIHRIRSIVFAIAGLLAMMSVNGISLAQEKVGFAQQIYVLKALKPSMKALGVLGSTLSQQTLESITRAALTQGVKIFVAVPKDPREISSMYKKLTGEKQCDMLWIPDAQDNVVLSIGFDYLKENTIADKVGLCVPTKELVGQGALCSITKEGDAISVLVNQRVAQLVGAIVPTEQNPSIVYVVK